MWICQKTGRLLQIYQVFIVLPIRLMSLFLYLATQFDFLLLELRMIGVGISKLKTGTMLNLMG